MPPPVAAFVWSLHVPPCSSWGAALPPSPGPASQRQPLPGVATSVLLLLTLHKPGQPERKVPARHAPGPHLLKAGRPTVLAQVSSMAVDTVLFSPHASPLEYVTVILSSETHRDGTAVRSHVSGTPNPEAGSARSRTPTHALPAGPGAPLSRPRSRRSPRQVRGTVPASSPSLHGPSRAREQPPPRLPPAPCPPPRSHEPQAPAVPLTSSFCVCTSPSTCTSPEALFLHTLALSEQSRGPLFIFWHRLM